MKGMRSRAVVLLLLAAAAPLAAAPTRIFSTQTPAAFQAGTLENVSLDAQGVLALADRAERMGEVTEPFAFSFAAVPGGWAVGTGNEGRVLRIAPDGQVTTLFDAPEPVIFALWADPDGTLFAGSSPEGRIYRIRDGEAEVWFEPGETYIWAIARGADGALWVATGTEGRLWRVTGKGQGTVAWDGEETHLRSLLPLTDGDLLIGTAPGGLVIRRDARGVVRTLHDAALSEVVAFAPAADGAIWAAVLASESSFLDAAPRGGGSEGKESAEAGEGTVIVVEGGGDGQAPAAGSRAAGARGPRSELLRLLPGGAVESLWSSADETIFSLLASDDRSRLWIGTGLEGKLYVLEADRLRLEKDLEERQIVGLAPGADGPALLTTNAAVVWRFAGGRERVGTYTSAALDAGQAARFGVFRWTGELPPGTAVRVSFRTGNSAEPDRTWTPWSPERSGDELSLADLVPARYVQYRIALSGGSASPRVARTELSYRQQNLRPAIERFSAMDPGQIPVPSGFNPSDQVYEPASPNREGIFTTLEPALSREERTKTVWRKGWRTLRWKVNDPNGDAVRTRLEVRAEQGDRWYEMADDLSAEYWSFDATVLPDGDYRFRLTASDEAANETGAGLVATAFSEVVTIDHAPPELRSAKRSGDGARVTVYDAASPLRAAELSIDGAPWQPLASLDGLIDGRTEELLIDEIPATARLVLLRVGDAAFNDRTYDLGARLGAGSAR